LKKVSSKRTRIRRFSLNPDSVLTYLPSNRTILELFVIISFCREEVERERGREREREVVECEREN